MRGSAFRLVLYSGTFGALALMAHPQRWGWRRHRHLTAGSEHQNP